jgi:hypothetical protein
MDSSLLEASLDASLDDEISSDDESSGLELVSLMIDELSSLDDGDDSSLSLDG